MGNDLAIREFLEGTLTGATSLDLEGCTAAGVNCFAYCASLRFVALPDTATSIGEAAFVECNALEALYAPKATSIGRSALYDCSKLTYIDISGAQSIDANAVAGCTSLTEISLPSLTSIGDNAFLNCTALVTVDLTGVSSVPVCGASVFDGCTMLTAIEVPSDLVASFKATSGWSTYADKIVAG